MALNSLSGSRCALWPALLHMSWPKPVWFGSPAPAAAKSGNEVNERVVLGHFPLISTQLKSNLGSDLRHRTFHVPRPPGVPGHRAGDDCIGGVEQDKGSVLAEAWDTGVGQLKQLRFSTHQSLEKQKGMWVRTGLQPVGGPGLAGNKEARLEQWGRGLIWGTRLSHPQASPLCLGALTRLPECWWHLCGGPLHWAVAESCTWIPEVLGKPVQTWVVRGEHGADSSTPQAQTKPHSPRG